MTTQLHIAQPDELPAPRVDDDSAAIVDEAIDTLPRVRTPHWLGDSGVRLHALASLTAQAERLLPQAIHDARDQGLTWAEIATPQHLNHHCRTPVPGLSTMTP